MIKKAMGMIQIPKKVFWSIVGFIVVIFAVASLMPKSYEVDVGAVKISKFLSYVTDEGMTQYKEKRIITAPTDGIIPSNDIKAGDYFKKNQIIINFVWDQDIPVRAPFDGVVLRVFEKDKKSVLRGTQILEFGNPSKIEIMTPLLSEEVVNVKLGQNAIISKWGGQGDLTAKVSRIEPSAYEEVSALGVKEQRVRVYLEPQGELEKWQQLGDGFRLEVKIIKTEKENMLMVPIGALFLSNNKTSLYLIDKNNKLKLIGVELGEKNREYAELLTPLEPSSKVVLYPSSLLKEGSSIKIRRQLSE